jgi:hypothetical protein
MSQIHRGLDASRRQPVRPRWRQCQSTPEGSRLIAEAWSVVRVEFRRALALRSEIRRAGRTGLNTGLGFELHGQVAPPLAITDRCRMRPLGDRG